MMTSKIEDRLRKNGVKIKKYYKWLRWSMINRNIYKIQFLDKELPFHPIEYAIYMDLLYLFPC